MLITQKVVYRRKFKKKFLFPFFENIKDVELCKIISKCLLKFLKIFYQLLKENSWNLHKFTSQMELQSIMLVAHWFFSYPIYLGCPPPPETALEKREKRGFNLREMLPLIRRSRQGRECKGIHYLKSCFSFAATISPTLLLCRCWRRCRRRRRRRRRLRRGDHRRCPALTAVTAAEICKLEGVLIDKEQRAAGSPRKT